MSTVEECIKKCVMCMQWTIIHPWKKKDNPAVYYNTDGNWGHYAKWNKPNIKTAWYESHVESGKENKSQNHRNRE